MRSRDRCSAPTLPEQPRSPPASPSAASINWPATGLTLGNSVTSACNTSQSVNIAIVAGAGASTNFIGDVIGYYL